jgi:hypothetical protein
MIHSTYKGYNILIKKGYGSNKYLWVDCACLINFAPFNHVKTLHNYIDEFLKTL